MISSDVPLMLVILNACAKFSSMECLMAGLIEVKANDRMVQSVLLAKDEQIRRHR